MVSFGSQHVGDAVICLTAHYHHWEQDASAYWSFLQHSKTVLSQLALLFNLLKVFGWMIMVYFWHITDQGKARPSLSTSHCYPLTDLRNRAPSVGSKAGP